MRGRSNLNQAIWLSFSYVSSMLVGILSSAILSRYFDKTEYGTYKQIMYVYQVMLTIFQLGLPAVFTYFLPRFSKEEGRYIVNKLNSVLLLLGFLFSVTLFLSSSYIAELLRNPELIVGLKLFSIFPLFTLPTLGVEGIYTVNRNTKFIAVYQVVTRGLMLFCILIPVVFIKNDYKLALLGWGVASFISLLIAQYAKYNVYKGVVAKQVDKLMIGVLKYSTPIMLSALLGMLFNFSNQFFISRYYGINAFAEYSNGYLTLPFVAIFIAPVRALLTPMFSEANLHSDYQNALNFMYSSMKKLSIVMIPLIVFSFIFSKHIITFIYGSAYSNAHVYFRVMLIFNFIEIFVFSGILNAIGKTRIVMYFTIISTCLLWSLSFACVQFSNSSPVLIVLIFILCNSLMNYVFPGLYLYFVERMKVLSLDVLFLMLKIAVVSCLSGLFVQYLLVDYIKSQDLFVQLLMYGILYLCTLIPAGCLIGVNYILFLKKMMLHK